MTCGHCDGSGLRSGVRCRKCLGTGQICGRVGPADRGSALRPNVAHVLQDAVTHGIDDAIADYVKERGWALTGGDQGVLRLILIKEVTRSLMWSFDIEEAT